MLLFVYLDYVPRFYHRVYFEPASVTLPFKYRIPMMFSKYDRVVAGAVLLVALIGWTYRKRWLALTALCTSVAIAATCQVILMAGESWVDGEVSSYNLKIVDDYLASLDKGGSPSIVVEGNADRELCHALMKNDPAAASRFVLYTILTEDERMFRDSRAVAHFENAAGTTLPRVEYALKHQKYVYAGDVYYWWTQNEQRYEAFPLLSAWQARDENKHAKIPAFLKFRVGARPLENRQAECVPFDKALEDGRINVRLDIKEYHIERQLKLIVTPIDPLVRDVELTGVWRATVREDKEIAFVLYRVWSKQIPDAWAKDKNIRYLVSAVIANPIRQKQKKMKNDFVLSPFKSDGSLSKLFASSANTSVLEHALWIASGDRLVPNQEYCAIIWQPPDGTMIATSSGWDLGQAEIEQAIKLLRDSGIDPDHLSGR
jgi:hypothetical protein